MGASSNHWPRVVAAATMTAIAAGAALAAGVTAADADQRPPDGYATATTPANVGGITTRTPTVPPAPRRLTRRGTLEQLSEAEAARLVGGVAHGGGWSCDIDFDDDEAIDLLPYDAIDTFALSPWWNQSCNGSYGRVVPTDEHHFHLGYVDPEVGLCLDPENPHDTPVGGWSKGEDCAPIDPVTEPRSNVMPHGYWYHLRLDKYDGFGSDDTPRPFTLERVRILSTATRVCYRMPPEGPWVVAPPASPFDEPGLVYCWASLSPGYWDLADWTGGTVGVTFTGSGRLAVGYRRHPHGMKWECDFISTLT